jgi:hypothetical protein
VKLLILTLLKSSDALIFCKYIYCSRGSTSVIEQMGFGRTVGDFDFDLLS